ncbi:MAG: D-amino acid dehydrogenase [Burkholderiaceae bacterium]|nr:D-amino acid dehydrogenase [Burkholderiaceae bacterium]
MKQIVVIGGGITGVTSAYALLRQGYQVTLVEKHRYAAMETSFANGGQLSASNAEVWTHPSTIVKGLKWLFKADAPLLVNMKPSWHKLSWFAEFMASIPKYEDNTVATTKLAIAAREHLFGWADQEGVDFDLKKQGILHIYRDRKGFEHASRVNDLLAQGGLDRRPVTPEEMHQIEPTVNGQYYGGFYTPSDSTGDIHKFTSGLAKACIKRGMTMLAGHEVLSVKTDGQAITLTTRHEGDVHTQTFDAVVVSAGVHSRAIAAQLGDRLNVYPVKGYSITVHLDDEQSQMAAPQVSLLDDETKIVTSRLGQDRFRVAGTAEFNGFNLDIRADRVRPLTRWVEQLFPNVSTRRVTPWAGLRPMMPNMMPRVGQGKAANVFYNTGHGHLGWTLSAITAQQLLGHVEHASRARQPVSVSGLSASSAVR